MSGAMSNPQKAFGKFLLLWSGQLISAVGSGLTAFGLGVYLYQQTGQASAMALVTLLAFMPSLLLSPVAGVLADRYDRRLLMMLGDSLSATGLIYILICLLNGGAELWQICLGVTISSVFSSLLDPAYKATVTDLLTEEQYTRASGFVQVAGSAKYLISPALAGYLLLVSDVKLLLVIDICTFFVTVASTLAVRRGLPSKQSEQTGSFTRELKEGWSAVSASRGVLMLVMMTSVLTFCLGFIETLTMPMILAFADSAVLGTLETVIALGMLASSIIIGVLPIKRNFVKILALSLFCGGLCMAVFGLRENVLLLGVSGFLFFATLPFANTSLDFLLRTNISNAVQGRAWSLIGLVSQLGFIAAYMLSGVLADRVFTPLLTDGGLLAGSVGRITGTGSGRGIGLLIILAGLLLSAAAIILYNLKSIKRLEPGGDLCSTG
ncbi:DHA3 family macrolide efflux protein-like MFS transporter [Paenibacillus sp. PastF-1]|nr:DHA3 family macrolide efflux protein-like MFS transporter [Paenibacillus sp. PastF-2]MDF9847225.1 DHA3 family macrolide efflux protein-like MFS transporter [Paenibacillus sp. PastM-2]MDF9853796.1 DHA3 family macrolide efflux protein-like MFS transporter [Paenibacillus sp. PastF-1]MDH6478718.1 DHA3 family macrolide efflux protein-like MFS transporter [Paenibacillus sp. PastH-2]MDH6506450.1 DHA3 family macrolide efflux protein-like MFS transporter [Paenibacillus sp. PastM-3]